ncbi:DUF4439 domain-containing protein [Demequina mangrovi]|nr:DUF4439 domain-containing protein [Demequina mangrovi]
MTPSPSRWMRGLAAAAVLAVATTGCSWRLETPPIPSRTPTATVVLRDDAALREQAVIDAADSSEAGALESALAPVRLEALGGVYVPYPSASPVPSPTGEQPSFAEAVDAAIADALRGADAAQDEDPGLAALLRSIALSHAMTTTVADLAGAEPGDRSLPGGDGVPDLAPAEATEVDGDVLAALALAHDEAAFTYEVIAARSEDEDARAEALTRSRLHEDRAAALLALPGVEDRRETLYDVPSAGTGTAEERAATALALETALAEAYAALIDGASAQDAGWILDAAYDAFAQAASLPGFEVADIPALPGLSVSR